VVTELVEVHEAIQIESLVSGLLRSARNDMFYNAFTVRLFWIASYLPMTSVPLGT